MKAELKAEGKIEYGHTGFGNETKYYMKLIKLERITFTRILSLQGVGPAFLLFGVVCCRKKQKKGGTNNSSELKHARMTG